MRIALLTSHLLLLTSAHALTDAWSVDAQQHTAVQRTYKQGETWSMHITLRDGLKPLDLTGATACFYWYTNATDNVWWTNSASVSSSGLITTTWTPAMDVGAASYYYWIGVWQAGATSPLWRVTGTIRLLTSPGFTPNALPLPVRTLDFAGIAVTNAPWLPSYDWQAGSNAFASADQNIITSAVPALIAAAFSGDARRLTNKETSSWVSVVGSNAYLYTVFEITVPAVSAISFSDDFYTRYDDVPNPGVPMTVGFPWTQTGEFGTWSAYYDGYYYVYVTFTGEPEPCIWQGESPGQLIDGTVCYSYTGDSGTATIHFDSGSTSVWTNVSPVSLRSDLAHFATTQQLAKAVANLPTSIPTNYVAIPQTQPTNLVLRLSASNDYIIAEGVLP